MIKKKIPTFVAGIVFALICFIALNAAMVPVSKSDYCGGKCHEMNIAYLTWELSPHGGGKNGIAVDCVSCHLPPKEKYFTHLVAKAYEGGKDVLMHHFGGEYDLDDEREKVLANMKNTTCLHCHNKLLARTDNSAARSAHVSVLNAPDKPEHRCVKCHEDAGHQRTNKFFTQQ